MSVDLYNILLPVVFGLEAAAAIQAQYPVPVPPPADLRPLASLVTTLSIFRCPTRNASRTLTALPGRTAPVFAYEFSHVLSWGPGFWTDANEECWTAVCHGGDLPFFFEHNVPGISNYTADEVALGESMKYYVGAFVRNGAPGSGRPDTPVSWPAIGGPAAAAFVRMQLDVPAPVVAQDPAGAACDIMDAFGYDWY